MNPNIGRRSGINKRQAKKKPSVARQFVEMNIHTNIVIKRDFMYLEDVKEAININTLEERIKLRKWLKMQLQDACSKADLVEVLEGLIDKDRHRLQKVYQITI